MSFLKEKIDEFKQIKDSKLKYYENIKEHLNSLKKQIVSLFDNPKENIVEIIKKVSYYNEKVNALFEGATYYNYFESEDEKPIRLGAKEILLPRIEIEKEQIIEKLTGNSLKLAELHTNHILVMFRSSDGYVDSSYCGLVNFFAYCDESVDTRKFYTVDEINKLISEEKMILSSNLHLDAQNVLFFEDENDPQQYILDNLNRLKYPIEDKNKVEIIYSNDLKKENENINFIINLDKVLVFMNHLPFDKDMIEKEIENINKHCSGIESIICASIVYKISNILKEIEQEEKNTKQICKNSVKQLLNDVEKELKEISQKELND